MDRWQVDKKITDKFPGPRHLLTVYCMSLALTCKATIATAATVFVCYSTVFHCTMFYFSVIYDQFSGPGHLLTVHCMTQALIWKATISTAVNWILLRCIFFIFFYFSSIVRDWPKSGRSLNEKQERIFKEARLSFIHGLSLKQSCIEV